MNLPATDIANINVTLSRVINAPREKVFKAWTDPALLTQWFGPEEVTTSEAQVELKIDGKYLLTMQESNGRIIRIGGQYREIVPGRKLVFTWILDGQNCSGDPVPYAETLVTIELEDFGASTRLTLTHDFLPTDRSKEEHTMGWTASLDSLAHVLD